eukprot:4345280-Amphidinium_carterae.1
MPKLIAIFQATTNLGRGDPRFLNEFSLDPRQLVVLVLGSRAWDIQDDPDAALAPTMMTKVMSNKFFALLSAFVGFCIDPEASAQKLSQYSEKREDVSTLSYGRDDEDAADDESLLLMMIRCDDRRRFYQMPVTRTKTAH